MYGEHIHLQKEQNRLDVKSTKTIRRKIQECTELWQILSGAK